MKAHRETWTGADLPAPLSPVYPDPIVPERRPPDPAFRRRRDRVGPALAVVVVLAVVAGGGVALMLKDRPTNQERIDRCISRGGTAMLDGRDRYDGCRIPGGDLP